MIKRSLPTIALLSGLIFTALPAGTHAGLRLSPAMACALLDDQGLRTRGFREDAEDFACRSQRRALSGGGQPRHTVRYRATGSQGAVERLALELQINSTSAVQRAHRQFADRANILFQRALDEDLPAEIEAAILAAATGTWLIAGHNVTLERVTAGTPHYDLRLSIE